MPIFFLFIFLLFSSATADCDYCLARHKKLASFFFEDADTGSCGYGPLPMGYYDGRHAAATPSLYNGGFGCGACFQIRCTDYNLCSEEGTSVIVTDLNRDNKTDFVLGIKAFIAMAKMGMAQDVLQLGVVDVEYKSVPCLYENKNLTIQVDERSSKPDSLVIKFLYQGGKTEILVVNVASQIDSRKWTYMSRIYGAVWETRRVPAGALQFRFAVTAGYRGKWYWVKNALPGDWKNGDVYDTGLQINDIAENGCFCDDRNWTDTKFINRF